MQRKSANPYKKSLDRAAAALCIARKIGTCIGWDQAYPAAIAREAGISPAWVSRYVGRHEEILWRIAMDEQTRIIQELRHIIEVGPHAPRERLRACLLALVPATDAKALTQLADSQGLLFAGPAYYELAWAYGALENCHPFVHQNRTTQSRWVPGSVSS